MFLHSETGDTLVLEGTPLEHTVFRADSAISKAVGAMGRSGIPDTAALVFQFDQARTCHIHMLGVRAPIRVWWVREGVLVETARLDAWTGYAATRADCVIELPANAPAGTPGETVTLE